jgi:hypothetical protein
MQSKWFNVETGTGMRTQFWQQIGGTYGDVEMNS